MLRASIEYLEDTRIVIILLVRASRSASREVKKAKLNFEKKFAENIKKDS